KTLEGRSGGRRVRPDFGGRPSSAAVPNPGARGRAPSRGLPGAVPNRARGDARPPGDCRAPCQTRRAGTRRVRASEVYADADAPLAGAAEEGGGGGHTEGRAVLGEDAVL